MKKILVMAAVAMMTAISIQAQNNDYDKKHELAISQGILSNSQIVDAFEEIAGAMFGEKLENEKFIGPISLEYFYHAKPWLGVGGIIVYGHNKQDAMMGKEKVGRSKNSYFTMMPAVKFDWFRQSNFGMYSKVAVGATIRSEKYDSYTNSNNDYSDSEVHVNWQLSLIGLEAGSPTFRGFAELGFGEQGIILGGFRFRF